jgi:hypothetical protein
MPPGPKGSKQRLAENCAARLFGFRARNSIAFTGCSRGVNSGWAGFDSLALSQQVVGCCDCLPVQLSD